MGSPPERRGSSSTARWRSTRSTSSRAIRVIRPRSSKGAPRPTPAAEGRTRPRHAGEGEAAGPGPAPAGRRGRPAHAGRRAAGDDPAGDRGDRRGGRPRAHRRVRRLRPPGGVGLRPQDGLPRPGRVRPRRGWGRVLRGPRQHDGGLLVAAALLVPPAPGRLAGEAARLSRLLPARPQRPPPGQGSARHPRRELGRVGPCSPPRNPTRAFKFMRTPGRYAGATRVWVGSPATLGPSDKPGDDNKRRYY